MLRAIADGEVKSEFMPRWVARGMYEQEMEWIRGETPFQKMVRKVQSHD
jgi:hypothetical protein